jgi:DNA-binding NarL/FixJ family response regulator
MIRVLIADDQDLVRSGLRMILDAEEDIEVIGEAADGAAAIELAARHRLDVVLMDVQMPRMDGLLATRALRAQATAPRVIVLTTFDVDEYVFGALKAGASAYLLKNAAPDELVRAIRVVVGGESLLAPSVTRRLIERFARMPMTAADGRLAGLTPREREIFALLVRGHTNAEMARELVISDLTVKTHVARILAKLDLRDRVQAVILAYESGFLQPGA